jgi:hypothetical protein
VERDWLAADGKGDVAALRRIAAGAPGNTGEIGDIHRIPPNLWLVRNEVGGLDRHVPGGLLAPQKQ